MSRRGRGAVVNATGARWVLGRCAVAMVVQLELAIGALAAVAMVGPAIEVG